MRDSFIPILATITKVWIGIERALVWRYVYFA